jgi:hypothetical protein
MTEIGLAPRASNPASGAAARDARRSRTGREPGEQRRLRSALELENRLMPVTDPTSYGLGALWALLCVGLGTAPEIVGIVRGLRVRRSRDRP